MDIAHLASANKTIGAKVETIYTIESNEDDKTYLQRMDENLTKILASLQ